MIRVPPTHSSGNRFHHSQDTQLFIIHTVLVYARHCYTTYITESKPNPQAVPTGVVKAMPTNEDFQGVSNCYVFKSRLQEYAQKVGLPTPVYETIKEGPSHEPSFRSTVIVNDVRYDSLPGFFNRKAAEQSAAEVSLLELAKSGEVNQSITQPVHETGLCKNLLQEYAQKMNYAMPLYQCKKDESPGRASSFSCTVEIGGIRYIGAAAKTKKEAEIKAARTALLAIQSSASNSSEKQVRQSQLTVIPCKKRGAESVANADENNNANIRKPKKARLKRKTWKRKPSGDKMRHEHIENVSPLETNITHEVESHANVNDESGVQAMESRPFAAEAVKNFENGKSIDSQNEKEMFAGKASLALNSDPISENQKKSIELHSSDSTLGNVAIEVTSLSNGDTREKSMDLNKQQDSGEMVNVANVCIVGGLKISSILSDLNPLEEKIQAVTKSN
ncbi:hypothetical protein L6164_015985 [Bauhinia variegata]|uniref:Uncharacterized protein n=1 Tax=Bauhinia variegata TaxID=167791 RepID=A0ACB9NLZ7_BAUVA|nr:hypothetical protein L6164_015985 [Bauhinia variegata]